MGNKINEIPFGLYETRAKCATNPREQLRRRGQVGYKEGKNPREMTTSYLYALFLMQVKLRGVGGRARPK